MNTRQFDFNMIGSFVRHNGPIFGEYLSDRGQSGLENEIVTS